MLFFSYFVAEEPGGRNPLQGIQGAMNGSGPAGAGICLAVVIFFVLILILCLAAAIGKKISRIVGALLHMIFLLICLILGVVQGNKDGIRKFVLMTVIVGGIAAFFNLGTAILMSFDCSKKNSDSDNNNYSDLSQNNSSQNNKKEISNVEIPRPIIAELKTSNSDNNSDNNEEDN